MSVDQFLFAGIACLLMGISKAGLKGLGVIVVIFMALAFDAKASTGVLMPLLIGADLIAIYTYREDVNWRTLWMMVPWIIIGVLIAVFVGDNISAALFKKVMAGIVAMGAFLMLWTKRLKWTDISVPKPVTVVIGLIVGFTTMLGNLAGPFSDLYFIAGRFPKDHFIATTAWLFFFINIFKLPFHIFVWETIDMTTLQYDVLLLPIVAIGFLVGYRLVKLFNNESFHYYVIGMTLLGGLFMLFQ